MQKAHTHIYIYTYVWIYDMCIYIYIYVWIYIYIYIYISVIFFPLPLLALVVFSHAIRDNKSHQAWKLVGSELPAEELNNSRDCGSKSCPEATWLRTCVDQPTVFVKMSMMSHCPGFGMKLILFKMAVADCSCIILGRDSFSTSFILLFRISALSLL